MGGRRGVDCSGSGYRLVVDYCGGGNELLGYAKCGEFLDKLKTF
jgi:hypothetical protein